MYKRIWEKYVPVVKILMKKSDAEPQVLGLNKLDFERAGNRKTGYRFTIEFIDGKVANIISDSPLAVELAHQLLEDEATQDLLREKNMSVSLNTKYQLTIAPIED